MNLTRLYKHRSTRITTCNGVMAILVTMMISFPVSAGPIEITDHSSLVTVTLENLDKDIDDLALAIGPVSNAGGVLGYSSSSQNSRQLIQDTYIRYEDQFGSNIGSYEATLNQSGNSDGFSYAADITSVNAGGTRSPMVSMDATVDTFFRVNQDTLARINVALDGNTFAGRNFVGLQLDGRGDAGEFQRLYYAPSRFGLAEVSATDSLEVTLQQGFTYQLTGNSNGSTLYSAAHDGPAPPSSLSYSLLTTQSLTGNSAENSLKPGASNYTGIQGSTFAHQFLLNSDEVVGLGSAAVWLDPEVAVGYDYSVDGAGLLGIELPDLSVFNNPTYQLFDLAGNLLADLLAGDSYDFSSVVNGFRLTGIDPALGLDPFSPGFTLGLRFDTPNMSTILVSQQPLTQFVNVHAVTAPGVFWLLLSGAATMLFTGRRGHLQARQVI